MAACHATCYHAVVAAIACDVL